jgi:titin
MKKSILVKSLLICLVFLSSLLVPEQALGAAPDEASNLVAAAGDATSIALSWQDNSDDEDGFRIYRRVEGEASFTVIGQQSANRTFYSASALHPDTTYYFKIKAFKGGEFSDFSNTASDTTEEAVVRVTSPVGGETWAWNETHNITWTSNGEGFQAQIRYRYDDSAWIEIASVPNTNSYSWTVPNVNSSHVRVAVRLLLDGDLACVDQSDTDFTIRGISLLVPLDPLTTVPAAPTGLNYSYHIPTVTLTWTDHSTNESGFKIERRTGSGAYTELGTVGANVTSYDDSITPTPGTAYTYRVRAYNAAGNSAYSNERDFELAEMLVSPLSPSNLAAEGASENSIRLTWDNNGSSRGTEVERQTGSGSFAKITETTGGASYIDTGLATGTTYTYRVRAFNEDSSGHKIYSDYSNPASAAPLPSEETTPSPGAAGQTELRFYIGSTEYYLKRPDAATSSLHTMDAAPMILEGRTLLPITYVAQPLGAVVNWNAAEERVTVALGSTTISVFINNSEALVNGSAAQIDPANPLVTPIIVPPGRTMLPLSFIASQLGCQVSWDPVAREVTVVYPKE